MTVTAERTEERVSGQVYRGYRFSIAGMPTVHDIYRRGEESGIDEFEWYSAAAIIRSLNEQARADVWNVLLNAPHGDGYRFSVNVSGLFNVNVFAHTNASARKLDEMVGDLTAALEVWNTETEPEGEET